MNNIKLRGIVAAVTGALLFGVTHMALADTTDDLLRKLHDKGVLTDEEYNQFNGARDTEKVKASSDVKVSWSDGIKFQSADKSSEMSINGRAQLDYRSFGKNDSQTLDQLDVRRAYLTVKGKIWNDYDFNITGDWATGQTRDGNSSSQLDQAYFGINWWHQARFRFGQLDMPFGLEHLTSDLFIDFQERGLTENLVPGKERGAMIHGDPFKGVYYGLAVSTGRGKNVSNKDQNVEGVDVIGRLAVNLAAIAGSTSDAVYHIGGAFSRGDLSQNQPTASGLAALAAGGFKAAGGTTEAKGIAFFSPSSFSAALTSEEVERTRLGLEGAVAYGPFKVQAEWMRHNYDGTASTAVNGTTAFDKDIDAWYLAGAWMVTGESIASTYKDGLWGRMKPKSNFNPTGPGMGGVLLSLRYSELDASDFGVGKGPGSVLPVAAAGALPAYNTPTGAHAWTAGVQWLLTPNTRLIANYVDTRFEGGSVRYTNDTGAAGTAGLTKEEQAVTVRAQIDF